MTFDDKFPFKDEPSERRGNYGVGASGGSIAEPSTSGPMRPEAPAGEHGQYRLALKGMSLKGLPDRVHVGRVVLEWSHGPIWSQKTHVLQKPGWRPTYVKHMDQGVVSLADGYDLTICTIDVRVSDDLVVSMREWRDEALAAVAFVVALLDERIAQEVVAEDLLLLDAVGTPRGVADQVQQIRAFVPTQRVLAEHREVLLQLSAADPSSDSPLVAASRWYLRAAQSGVTPDAVVFLWIALEALSKPPYGTKMTKTEKKVSDVEWVERAVTAAGVDPGVIAPSIGRLAGLRAEIVHGGVESPALLRDGYYSLEALVRLLIRDALGSGPHGWPIFPGASTLRGPFERLAATLRTRPRTQWRSPPSP